MNQNSKIVVTTVCDNMQIAKTIIDVLLNKKLVAGSQITEIKSKYWWQNKIEESIEYIK
ncbi:MAG: divalent cation tolerance protein CutA [Mycoplasmatota bacterium]